jgi:uncharacterized membrane protein
MSLSFVHPRSLSLLALLPLVVGLALLGRHRSTRKRFWVGLSLRVLLLTLVILALSGAQLRTRADTLTAVFVLDVSDSIPVEEQARGESVIRQAAAEMPSGDRAAVVVFGQDALVERMASEDPLFADLTSVPVRVRTDIASALQLAMALFPDEGAKRLVLLSDGRENLGHALAEAELAAAHEIELDYVSLKGPEGEVEVRLDSLQAPTDVRLGQRFDLTASLHSTGQVGASLRVLADGKLIHSQELRLQPGSRRVVVPIQAEQTGFRRFRAEVVPDADARLQNNQATAFTVVVGPPRVLIVEGGESEADHLAAALRAAEMEVAVVPPGELPTSLPELAAYDGLVLANVARDALPPESLEAISAFVQDLGHGLLMTGGERAYGAGGYLRTPVEKALPVDMDVRSKEQSPNLALVLVVDKSGSMGRCHCDNPDLNQTYERREVGQPKVDIAKEAIMRAASALGPQDYMGVVAFDQAARWALDVQRVIDVIELERTIGSIEARGQTNLRAGVEAAYAALVEVEARYKHVILMTDGWVREGVLTNLVKAERDGGVTVSVVAAGGGSAQYLAELAELGGGRYYPAVDILKVPDFFLKETVRAVGEYIIEEPFYPLPAVSSPVLRGLDVTRMPGLLGYNGTTPKSAARTVLVTPRGDPLLATWQYGLGRSAAWTSDVKGQWAKGWVAWDDFARFAAQLVDWILPAPQVEGMHVEAALEEAQAVIRADLTDEDGVPLNFLQVGAVVLGPDLGRRELELEQVGAGQYEATLPVSEAGTYLLRVDARDGDEAVGQRMVGLVVPYSPEYKATGMDETLLGELAWLTGGSELVEPLNAFLHDLPSADRAREIWRPLLLAVSLLFPVDVAVRRLVLGRRDIHKAIEWLRVHSPFPRQRAGERQPVLGQLFAARDRARVRRERAPSQEPTEVRMPAEVRAAPQGQARARPQEDRPAGVDPAGSEEDTLARLRRAKGRARRDK